MGSSIDFLIDIKQRSSGNAVTEIDRLLTELDQATAKYKQMENAAVSAAKRAEQITAKREAAEKGLSAVGDTGNVAAYRKAQANIERLIAEEQKMKTHAASTAAALEQEASAVTTLADKIGALRQKGSALAQQEKKLADAEKQTAAAEKSAQKAAAGSVGSATSQLQQADKQTAQLAGQAHKVSGAFGALPGPLGRVGQQASNTYGYFQDLKSVIGSTGAAAAIGTVAIVALVAALAAGAAAALHFSLSMASAQRDTAITAAAIVGGNEAVGASFHTIESQTGVASDRLIDLERSLKLAGVSAADMPTALRAIAEQESALGDTSGSQALIDSLKDGTRTASGLAAEMDSKFGGVVQKRMLGLDQQIARLKSGFANMFSTLNIEPILKALKSIVDLFDSDTAAGKQMQDTFKTVFQPLLDAATSAIPSVRRAILYAELGVVNFINAIDPVATKIRDSFETGPIADFAANLASSDGVLESMNDNLTVMVGVIEEIVDQVNKLVEALNLASDGLKNMPSMGGANGNSPFGNLTGSATDATSGLPGAMQDVGENTSKGLADGISAGGDLAIAAMGGVVGGVLSAAKVGFDQHSPSKKFEHIGLMNTSGLALGHEKGANDVEASVDAMTSVPSLRPSGGRGGGGTTITIQRIDIRSGGDPQDLKEAVEEGVLSAIERAGVELGADMFGDDEEAAA